MMEKRHIHVRTSPSAPSPLKERGILGAALVAAICLGAFPGQLRAETVATANTREDSCPNCYSWVADSSAPVTLTAAGAMELAMQRNVEMRLAQARTVSTRGEALQAAADLLPHLTGTLSQSRVFRENLAAMGFSGTGLPFPPLIGPFDVFDARIHLVQTVFDFGALRRAQAAGSRTKLASLQEDLAREQVSAAAALAYIETLRARRAIEAAEADDALALNLLDLAQNKRSAGTAAGIDVIRAKTREAEERLRLVDATTASDEANIRLKHILGLPLGRQVTIEDSLQFAAAESPREEDAAAAALGSRLELQISEENFRSEEYALKAAHDENLGSVAVTGDVGLSGNKPDAGARTTGSVGARLSIPFAAGGRIEGAVREHAGLKSAAQARLDDVRVQVEEDARLAVKRLATAAERVKTAEQTVQLAETEMEMARGRFAAGAADNTELVDAQTALARARDVQIAALAQHNQARINLAMALGRMRSFKF